MDEERSFDVSGVNRASRSTARIRVFSVGIALFALVLLMINRGSTSTTDEFFSSWVGLPGLAALFAASELMVVHFRVGRSAHTVSVIEATLVVALFHSSPVVALAAQLVGCGTALDQVVLQPQHVCVGEPAGLFGVSDPDVHDPEIHA